MAVALRRVGFGAWRSRSMPIGKKCSTHCSLRRRDWAVGCFAGHGVEIDGTNYLVPVDARLANVRDVEDEAVTLERVLSLATAKKLRIVILDAGRDNPLHVR
jgi:hypothetical protein